MKEDIKILEKLLKEYKNSGRINYFVDLDDLQAIEHLIVRNKELEQNYINPSKTRISYYDKGKGTKVVVEGFVPKSKVRELKENIHYLLDNNGIARGYQIEIDRLFEELLED